MNKLSFIPLGGIGDVTKNMYLYEYEDQFLLVDCGLGFPDETMVGVDLLLPDVSYVLNSPKKIAGMVLTHGHEDHIGALPFIIPQILNSKSNQKPFPILATPLTAALANEKLKEFGIGVRVQTVKFEEPEKTLGMFKISFIRINHSVPDSSNLFIQTPAGNFYHGSDYKFDYTPEDGKRTDFFKIAKAGNDGVICLMSDSLHSEREGYTPSEKTLIQSLEREMEECKGKFIVTTYSSNISRLNQAVRIGEKLGRKVCFVGRSMMKAKEVARSLGYMSYGPKTEIRIEQVSRFPDNKLLLLVAGSQGQENSAMTRIANGEHREISLSKDDVVVFSSESIPGNEVAVNSLMDTIAKEGARVIYPENFPNFHVSGHGSSQDIMLMISLTKPKKLIPIGGTYTQMVAFREIGKKLGYKENDVFLLENGQEVIFSLRQEGAGFDTQLGRKIPIRNVYVDEITGEEVEGMVLRDRQKLSEGGLVIVVTEIDASTSQIVNSIDVISKGFSLKDAQDLKRDLQKEISTVFKPKLGRVINWIHVRQQIGEISERFIFKKLKTRPLVLPLVIEV